MMRRVSSFVVVLALAYPVVGRAQAKPDFSGTWTLDASRSDAPMGRRGGAPGPVTLVVKQTAGEIAIETRRGENSQTATYKLDGSESTNPGGRGGEAKSKSHWDGATLVTEQTQTMNGPNGEMTISSKIVRSLGADGKEMTVVTTASTPQGERTSKQIYTKQ
jgi:hypothetical protein